MEAGRSEYIWDPRGVGLRSRAEQGESWEGPWVRFNSAKALRKGKIILFTSFPLKIDGLTSSFLN